MVHLIAGGGTGGHVYPAIAIADALVEAGIAHDDVRFVGSARGIERTAVPDAGYEVELLPGRGIKRSFSLDNVGAVVGLVTAVVRAWKLVRRLRPAAVVSVGGYAAFPCVAAAIITRTPLIVAESNAVPGAVHRLAGRFARACAVAYPNTALPRSTVTGNPVRDDIKSVDRDDRRAAKATLGFDEDRVVIAAFGGSLGAASINRAMTELTQQWRDRADLAIYHVIGKRDWPARNIEADGALQLRQVEYETDMPALYAAADILVCRAGATTSAEVAVIGIPAIFVPLPHAPGDHQTFNARAFSDISAGKLLPDAECSGASLAALIEPLVAEPAELASMSRLAKSLGRPDAATRVARLVLEHSRTAR